MEDGQIREAEAEDQKSLLFNFRDPRLQLTQDAIVAQHAKHLSQHRPTVTTCDELSSSRGREELAHGCSIIRHMLCPWSVLRQMLRMLSDNRILRQL